MPFVNVKLVKNQISLEQKKKLVSGLTDLIVNVMGRDRELTVITVDELDESNWAIGGVLLSDSKSKNETVIFVNIKVSKGTTNEDEMEKMIELIKELVIKIVGNSEKANYIIIDELNPDGWGFDGITMTTRNKMEQ